MIVEGLDRRAQEAEAALDGPGVAYLALARRAAAGLARRDVGADDVGAALAELSALATIDVDVPTLSRRRPVRVVKGTVKRLGGWYMRYLGEQVTSLGLATVRFGSAVVERTEALERSTDGLSSEVAQLSARLARLEASQAPGGR